MKSRAAAASKEARDLVESINEIATDEVTKLRIAKRIDAFAAQRVEEMRFEIVALKRELQDVQRENAIPPAADILKRTQEWLDPTPEMLNDLGNAIWNVIKTWDINVPGAYSGYCGATGNHVRAILDALFSSTPPDADALERARKLCRLISDTCVSETETNPEPCTPENCLVVPVILAAKAEGRREERERLENPPHAVIARGVKVFLTTRSGPDEILVHDIWQAMLDELRALAEPSR